MTHDKPTSTEYEEMCNEARLRVMKTERESYWTQYEHGMINRKTVQILIEINSKVADRPDGKMMASDLRKHWQIPNTYKYMVINKRQSCLMPLILSRNVS